MRWGKPFTGAVHQQVDINLDSTERGLADAWVVQVREELVGALAGARSPEAMYRDAAKVGRRWLDNELTRRHRSGAEIPRIRAFLIRYFSDARFDGEALAVINVLTGRIEH